MIAATSLCSESEVEYLEVVTAEMQFREVLMRRLNNSHTQLGIRFQKQMEILSGSLTKKSIIDRIKNMQIYREATVAEVEWNFAYYLRFKDFAAQYLETTIDALVLEVERCYTLLVEDQPRVAMFRRRIIEAMRKGTMIESFLETERHAFITLPGEPINAQRIREASELVLGLRRLAWNGINKIPMTLDERELVERKYEEWGIKEGMQSKILYILENEYFRTADDFVRHLRLEKSVFNQLITEKLTTTTFNQYMQCKCINHKQPYFDELARNIYKFKFSDLAPGTSGRCQCCKRVWEEAFSS